MPNIRITSGPRSGEELQLDDELTIGRDPNAAQLVLDDDLVSREHARISRGPNDSWVLRDLDSTNGTWVTPAGGARRRVMDDYTLRSGDRIGVGSANIEFLDPDARTTVVAPGPGSGRETSEPSPPRAPVAAGTGSSRPTWLPVVLIGAGALAVVALAVVGLLVLLGGGDDDVSATEVVKKYEASAVLVRKIGTDRFQVVEGGGSGIVLDDQGHILTNNHVVEGFASLEVQHPVSGNMIPAQIVGRSPCDDLAVIKVQDARGFVPATLGSSEDLDQGSKLYVVGFPAGELSDRRTIAITEGTATRLDGQDDYYGLRNTIQYSNPTTGGNSGGPLIDSKGHVVGVVYAGYKSPEFQNVNFAVDGDEAKRVSDQLMNGNISWVGINSEGYYDGIYEDLYEESLSFEGVESGLLLTGIATDSPLNAESEEWLQGDVLTAAEGKPLATPADLCSVIRSHRSGDKIKLDGLRLGEDADGWFLEPASTTITLP